MKITFLLFLLVTYFLHRCAIKAYFYIINGRKALNKIKSDSKPFNRYMGFYLLKANNGKNILSIFSIYLINIELLFFPVVIFFLFMRHLNNYLCDISLPVVKLLALYDYCVWIIVFFLCLLVKSKYRIP